MYIFAQRPNVLKTQIPVALLDQDIAAWISWSPFRSRIYKIHWNDLISNKKHWLCFLRGPVNCEWAQLVKCGKSLPNAMLTKIRFVMPPVTTTQAILRKNVVCGMFFIRRYVRCTAVDVYFWKQSHLCQDLSLEESRALTRYRRSS